MERRIIETYEGESFVMTQDVLYDINELIDHLNEAKKHGATSAQSWFNDATLEVKIHPMKRELESTEAYNERVAELEEAVKHKDKIEKELYEKLKEKYG